MNMTTEKSTSNRSHCAVCKKVITKGDIRLKDIENVGIYTHTNFYCKECGKKYIKVTRYELKKMEEMYNRLEKSLEE